VEHEHYKSQGYTRVTYCRFSLLLQNKRELKHKCCLCPWSVSRSPETENKVGIASVNSFPMTKQH